MSPVIVQDKNSPSWILAVRVDLCLEKLQELLHVGGMTKHMSEYLVLLDNRTIYSNRSTTISTTMNVEWLAPILPDLSSLIP